jgi:SAM-dependent methyltransferase
LAPNLDLTEEGFSNESYHLLAESENDHFWFINRNNLICWLVRRFAPDAKRVLEIGCGNGFVIHALRQALPMAVIAGSELHSAGLETARSRHKDAVEFFQMDARHSGILNTFDLIGAFDVLEHIPEDTVALREIAQMLVPGGVLLSTVPQHPWMWSTADDLAHHQRRYARRELANKVRAAGLQPLYTTSYLALAFPAMVMVRLVDKMMTHLSGEGLMTLKEVHDREFAISAPINTIFDASCRIEHYLRRAGVPLPFGGSQVLVAQRPALTTQPSARKAP